jgi:hypothetical protein
MMDVVNTLAQVFPTGQVTNGGADKGGFFEVRGLSKGTVPQGCEVVASGHAKRAVVLERRGSFLVRTHGGLLFFHICVAHPDSGYAEFVVGHECPQFDPVRSREFQEYALRSIEGIGS